MKPSSRSDISPFEVMEAFREAEMLQAQGRDIIHLSLGQPGSAIPGSVKEALKHAIGKKSLGYTDARGTPELRRKIAGYYAKREKIDISPEQVFITLGSSSAFYVSLMAMFEAKDRVALARPCYPAYPNMLKASNLEPVFIDTDESTQFQPRAAHLRKLNDIQGLIIASPSNPTGTLLHEKEMRELLEYAAANHIRVISDEIYHHVTYGEKAHCALKFTQEAVVLGSFSKYFLLPGWRLGWAIVPESMMRTYEMLMQSFFVSPSAPAQIAALEIFDHLDELDEVVKGYARNRDRLIECLSNAGIHGLKQAEGAFYLYANVSAFTDDSKHLCQRMLEEIGVCAVPGVDFDRKNGNKYIRFSYCGTQKDVAEAAGRLEAWLPTAAIGGRLKTCAQSF